MLPTVATMSRGHVAQYWFGTLKKGVWRGCDQSICSSQSLGRRTVTPRSDRTRARLSSCQLAASIVAWFLGPTGQPISRAIVAPASTDSLIVPSGRRVLLPPSGLTAGCIAACSGGKLALSALPTTISRRVPHSVQALTRVSSAASGTLSPAGSDWEYVGRTSVIRMVGTRVRAVGRMAIAMRPSAAIVGAMSTISGAPKPSSHVALLRRTLISRMHNLRRISRPFGDQPNAKRVKRQPRRTRRNWGPLALRK